MSENRPTTQPTIIPVPEPVERASWKHRLYAAAVYYPSFFWNVWNGRLLKRWQWWTEIDQDVVLGAVPFRRDIGKMVQLGVKAIVNTCEEFPGHTQLYQELGIVQYHMPTIDFTHPTLQSVSEAVDFMQDQIAQGHRVYVHCKAGRARSATVVMCYLMAAHGMTPQQAQELLVEKRRQVLASVYSRPVVQAFEERLQAAADSKSSEAIP